MKNVYHVVQYYCRLIFKMYGILCIVVIAIEYLFYALHTNS